MFVLRYSEQELREVMPRMRNLTEVLRHFGLRPAGGNHKLLRRWLDEWGISWGRAGRPRPGARRVLRPPYEQLLAEVAAAGWSAVGRKYGVSDNAVRKWVRAYEREQREEAPNESTAERERAL
jgi:transposase